MNIEVVKKLTPFQRLCYWIKERELVRTNKEHDAPKPWTDDEILQSYRFCNVRRMDDKVSKWLLEYWYQRYFDHPSMPIACTMARLFNQPNTLAAIGFPRDPSHSYFKNTKKLIRCLPRPVFNGAYIVSTNGIAMDKIDYVVDRILVPMYESRPAFSRDSMETSVKCFQLCNGIGSFMAGQIVADLRWAVSGKWLDKGIWAPIGPGSRRGMNRLHGRPTDQAISYQRFTEELLVMIKQCSKHLAVTTTRRLEAIDWQNCLCEYDKYSRTLNGEGKPKQKYPGI